MKRLFLFFTFLYGLLMAVAAQDISGTVVDNQGKPLEFVSVALLQAADSSFVGGCVSDEQGRFSLPMNGLHAANLLLRATSVSYRTVTMRLGADTSGLHLVMEDDVVEYASVIVKGKRPFTKNVGDKVVFNPQLLHNIDAMQVDDMLRYVPGVMVSKGDVTYKGKSAVILVDDRPVDKDYLSNLNASDIERVELLGSHGGMYSATIQGGIINIVTKKGLLGLRGTARLEGSTHFRNTYDLTPSANLFFGTQKWNVYARYSFDLSRRKAHNDITNEFLYNNTVHESSRDDVVKEKFHQYAVGTVFHLAEDHRVSLELNGTHTPYGTSIFTTADEVLTLADGSHHAAYMTSEDSLKSYDYNIAGSYKWDIDTLGSSLNVLMNYTKKMTKDDNHLITTYQDLPARNINEIDAAKTNADNVSGRADFEKNWKGGWKLTLGGSYSTSKRYSETVFNRLLDNSVDAYSWNYREQIAGGYLGVEKQLGCFYAIGRMQVEHTRLRGFATGSDEVKRNTTDFVPYVYLRYSTPSGWNFDAKYTHKLKRPPFSELTGYMERYSDVLYAKGNPDLKHDVTNSVSLSASHRGHSLEAEYQSTADAMITAINTADGVSYVQTRNEGTNKILFFTYTYGGNLFPWWYTNCLAQIAYLYYPDSYYKKSIWWGLFNWVNRFSWERVGTFEVRANYMTKYLQANIMQERNGVYLTFSYERNIGKQFTASVGVNDILNGSRVHSVQKSPTLVYDFSRNYYNPAVWCKLTYKFSNKRKTKTDELENKNDIIERM